MADDGLKPSYICSSSKSSDSLAIEALTNRRPHGGPNVSRSHFV